MPWIAPAIGAGVSIVGGMIGDGGGGESLFAPIGDTRGLSGGTSVYNQGNGLGVNYNPSGTTSNLYNNWQMRALERSGGMGTSPTGMTQQFAYGQQQPMFGAYNALNNGLSYAMDDMRGYGQSFQNTTGMLAGMYQNQGGIDQARAYNPYAQAEGQNWQSIMQGRGMLGDNYQQTVNKTYADLTAQAQRPEQQAVNSTLQNLFQKGIMGSSSGARALGELDYSQRMADLSRQQAAETMGQQRFGLNQQYGQSLLGQGMNGLLAGGQLNLQNAQILGNLDANRFDAMQGLNTDMFTNRALVQDTNLGRLNQRFANMQGMFNFGNDLYGQDLNFGNLSMGNVLGMNTDARNEIALAKGGQPVTTQSPDSLGSLIGGGMMDAGTSVLEAWIKNQDWGKS